MRVISQDGTIDISYKIATILKRGNTILARNDRAEFELAEYSTEVKAIKAMEILKEHYGLLSFMKLIAGTTKYESFIRRFTEDDFIKATTEYFQFPQDDEIEV